MILDTNALSGWADGNKKVERVLANQTFLALPVIVLGEYRFGLSGSTLKTTLEPRLAELEPSSACWILHARRRGNMP